MEKIGGKCVIVIIGGIGLHELMDVDTCEEENAVEVGPFLWNGDYKKQGKKSLSHQEMQYMSSNWT
eukprot:6104118-Ditylum_brightwellii.AAC.1